MRNEVSWLLARYGSRLMFAMLPASLHSSPIPSSACALVSPSDIPRDRVVCGWHANGAV